MIRFDRDFIKDMKENKDIEKNERRLRIIRDALFIVIPLIIIVFIFLTYIKDIKTIINEVDTLRYEMNCVLTSIKSNDSEMLEASADHIDESSKHMQYIFLEKKWKLLSHIPYIKKYIRSANTIVDIIVNASDDVLKPGVEVMKQYPLSQLKSGDGFRVDTINAYLDYLEKIEPEIEDMTSSISQVKVTFSKSENISKYVDKLNSLTAAYKENGQYIQLFREFIGDGSDRMYLIAAQNSSEIRASGGFPGSFGTIRIENGVMSIGDFQTVYKVLSERVPESVQVTEHEKTIFSSWMRLSRDVCYNPDFERVGSIWAHSYESRNGIHVDGVISLTPVIIQKILKYTGGVTLSDGTQLNGDNATKVLQKELYYKYLSNRTDTNMSNANDYVDALFAETAKLVMSKFVSEFDYKMISQYAQIFIDGGKDRTILMWMEDEKAQTYVREAGCSGGLNHDKEHPQAGVYFSCSYASKMGWFINLDTQIGDSVINTDGSRTYDMTVVMSNAIVSDDIYKAGEYILGAQNGGIKGFIHLFAPEGGTISDITTSNSMKMVLDEYEGLQLAYNLNFVVYADKTITIKYKVTTAPGVDEPLTVSKTPTLQEYR